MPAQCTDPLVSRAKFNREVDEYRSFSAEYVSRGWLLIEADFPKILVVLAATKVKPVPIVMGVSFDYTNYDAAPPSVKMVNPFTREAYKAKDLPNPLNRALAPQEVTLPGLPPQQKMLLGSVQPYMQAYGPDDIPFLCLAGVREYHEHPAHSGDLWELHRKEGAGRLVRLLDVISRYGIEPITGFGVQLVPQINLNYGPPPS
jgi:Predicted metal binding domain